jgi:predicted NUDIX family NTP pyrophosphohydrolase
MYRYRNERLEVFLVHPGGPFWAKKNHAAWSIPKGEFGEGQDPAEAAKREVYEETGIIVEDDLIPLGTIRQSGGKTVHAFACNADCDPGAITSNSFEMEWPPKSGRYQSFPEVDRAGWFPLDAARQKLHKGQVELVERLRKRLGQGTAGF